MPGAAVNQEHLTVQNGSARTYLLVGGTLIQNPICFIVILHLDFDIDISNLSKITYDVLDLGFDV